MSRAFTVLLALLIGGFFVVPGQQQRNWFLYLAAAAAHWFLFDRRTLRTAFAGRAGWTVPLLLAMPLLSLTWSGVVPGDYASDLLLAAYCILLIYLGIAHLTRYAPQALQQLQQILLLGANLGALLSLGHWAVTYDPHFPRLPGWLGLDNPVHASILLLAATLPVCTGIARGRLQLRWGWACAAPLAFILLAGPRAALAAWLIVVVVIFRPRLRVRTLVAGAVALGAGGAAALLGSDVLKAIWLDRGLSFRPEIWEQTWSALLSCNPLIGCGVAAPLEIEYRPGMVTDRAHGLYVAALYHQGVLGAAVFLATITWLLRSVRGGPLAARAGAARFEGERAAAASVRRVAANRWDALPGRPGDWAVVLVYVLLATTTSGDHLLVRTTLFWCYFWLPVLVLAASATTLGEP